MSPNLEWPNTHEAEVLLRRLLADKFSQKALIAIASDMGISLAGGIQSSADLADNICRSATPRQRVQLVMHVAGFASGPKPRRLPSLDKDIEQLRSLCTATEPSSKTNPPSSNPTGSTQTPDTPTATSHQKQVPRTEISERQQGNSPLAGQQSTHSPQANFPSTTQPLGTPNKEQEHPQNPPNGFPRIKFEEWAANHPYKTLLTAFILGCTSAFGFITYVQQPALDELNRYRTLLGGTPEQIKGRLDGLPPQGGNSTGPTTTQQNRNQPRPSQSELMARANLGLSSIREKNGLRPIRDIENELPASELPFGVYFYLFDDRLRDLPVSSKPDDIEPSPKTIQEQLSLRWVEVHKLQGGSYQIAGFTSQTDAQHASSPKWQGFATLYTAPWEEAQTPITIPIAHIKQIRSREFRNFMLLELRLETAGKP